MPHRATRRTLHSIAAQAAGGAALSASAIAALVSWWALDETSGNRADSHGSNTLTDVNTVGYAEGKQGNAADLVYGNTEYFSRALNDSLTLNQSDFTICFWVKADTLSNNVPIWYRRTNILLAISMGSDGKPMLRIGTGAGDIFVANYPIWGTALSTGTWYFVCGWHDVSEKNAYISVNNAEPVSAQYTETISSSAGDLNICSMLGGHRLDGLLDELCMFKGYMLTEAERTALYNSGNGVTYAQAVGA